MFFASVQSTAADIKLFYFVLYFKQASNVFEKWKKSPRNRALSVIARSDYDKGMERIGR